MTRRFVRLLAACVMSLSVALAAWADTEATLVSAELELFLRPDGKAELFWSVEWNCTGGTMSGFYFEESGFSPAWDMNRCYADLADGTRVPLSISPYQGDTWDVILAEGRRFAGRALYTMSYAADFSAAGFIGRTTKDDGTELVYFDWGANAFDTPMSYRAVRIVFPVAVAGEKLSDEEKETYRNIVLTEPFMNEDYKIDYYGSKGEGDTHYLTALFHQEGVEAYETQALKFYVPVSFFEGSQSFGVMPLAQTATTEQGYDARNYSSDALEDNMIEQPLLAVFLFGAVICAALAMFAFKASTLERKKAALEAIQWAGDVWTPPRLQVGTYQVPGKVIEDLHPAEVAILLDLPVSRVVEIMIEGLTNQGIIEVANRSPLQIRILSAKKAAAGYEEEFLAAFDSSGNALSGLLSDFIESLIKRLQEKIWDCDFEATKAFYRKRIAEQAELEALPDSQATRTRASRDPYWFYWHSYWIIDTHPERFAGMALPEEFGKTYADFMKSSSCFSGCYSPANVGTSDACYSACHNACHDACHSACHDACHSACHDACHSACVSGGAH